MASSIMPKQDQAGDQIRSSIIGHQQSVMGHQPSIINHRPSVVPVSVLVPVKNEAENLRRCLPALAWADEVFVVDSQSTDDTVLVAEAHGATVVEFDFNGVYPKKKNWCWRTCRFATSGC